MPNYDNHQPDPLGELIPRHILFNCDLDVDIYWDQWACCILKCTHGAWSAVSGGLNLFQAYSNAVEKMLSDHPPKCETPECEDVKGHGGKCYV